MPYVDGTLAKKYEIYIPEIGRNIGSLLEMMAAQILYGTHEVKSAGNLIFEELQRMKVADLQKIKDPYLQAWLDGSDEDEIIYDFLKPDQKNRLLAITEFIDMTIRNRIDEGKKQKTAPAEPSQRAAVPFAQPIMTRERAKAFRATESVDELVVKKNEKIREILRDRLEKVRQESKSTIRDDRLFSLLALSDYVLKNYDKNRAVIDLDDVEERVKTQLKKDNIKLERFMRGIDATSSNPLAKMAGRKSEYVKMKIEAAKIKDQLPEPQSVVTSKRKSKPID